MKKIVMLVVMGLLSCNMLQAKQIVAVGTFKNKSQLDDNALKSLIDRITNGIVNTRKFKVVDTARLKEAFDELKKVDMGISEAEGAPKVGKVKCAGYIIYGTVLDASGKLNAVSMHGVYGSKFTGTIELNLRFMNAETGELMASKIVTGKDSVSCVKSGEQSQASNLADSSMQKAIQNAADKVVEELMELAFPTEIIKVNATAVYVNLPQERSAQGMVLNVFMVGEELIDPDTGDSLGSSEEFLGKLKVIRTAPKFAIAQPIAPLTADQLQKGMRVRPVSNDELRAAAEKQRDQEAVKFRKRF